VALAKPTIAATATKEAITDPFPLIFSRVDPPIIRAMAIQWEGIGDRFFGGRPRRMVGLASATCLSPATFHRTRSTGSRPQCRRGR